MYNFKHNSIENVSIHVNVTITNIYIDQRDTLNYTIQRYSLYFLIYVKFSCQLKVNRHNTDAITN